MWTFLKEFFLFFWWFFFTLPRRYSELKVVQFKYFPPSCFAAMSWCGHYVSRKDPSTVSERNLRHETIHLKQAKARWFWIGFYWRYVYQWLKGNPFWPPFKSAYKTIPYEMEAEANDDGDDSYVDNYDKTLLNKYYNIKKRKKTYKEHKSEWKAYCKSLRPQNG